MNKCVRMVLIILLFLSGTLFSENNVSIQHSGIIPSTPNFGDNYTILIRNDDVLHGMIMAFGMQVTGDIAMNFTGASSVLSPYNSYMAWNIQPIGPQPYDTMLVAAYWSPEYIGFPPGPLRQVITLGYKVQSCSWMGEVCIDTCSVTDSQISWLWIDEGGNSLSPTFNSGSGPLCIDVAPPPCGIVTFTLTPDNNMIVADHCTGAQFQFEAEGGVPPDTIITAYKICPGASQLAGIDNGGLFTFAPSAPGTYNVSVVAFTSCAFSPGYGYSVILTNVGQEYTNCPAEMLLTTNGELLGRNLGLANFDTDPINEEIEAIGSPGKSEPVHNPQIAGGIFKWLVEYEDRGIWTFEITASDPFGETTTCQLQINVQELVYKCGDANSDGLVNVSDAVYIINYVFIGGTEPIPYLSGDVNCDTVVNVSDAVSIINFIFIGGDAPCSQCP